MLVYQLDVSSNSVELEIYIEAIEGLTDYFIIAKLLCRITLRLVLACWKNLLYLLN